MKGKLLLIIGLFLWAVPTVKGEEKDSIRSFSVDQKTIYPFVIQDTPALLFTMRQIDQDYLSGYRLYARALGNSLSPKLNYLVQAVASFAIFVPLSHEEAHRSILSSKSIGAVSQPFHFSKKGGYVDGVPDNLLQDLRDHDFPNYARLYTAGLESDYMLTHREEALFAFEQEKYKDLAVEYLMRKAMMLQYYLIGFVKYDVDGPEEPNELERDIVGNDVYGIVRHLHRPTMAFQRYTRYADLTTDEVSYLKKMGYRSLLNLVNLNIIGIPNIRVTGNLSMNFGLGHAMSPFGDFIDENVWMKYRQKWMIDSYLRQYQNRGRWFLAGGFGIKDYALTDRLISSVNLHLWDQPDNLGFNDTQSKLGGAVEWTGSYFFPTHQNKQLKGISLDLGFTYKTAGFLPEELEMKEHFGVRLGMSLALDK